MYVWLSLPLYSKGVESIVLDSESKLRVLSSTLFSKDFNDGGVTPF